ncbi:helix-turn-helix transcriptional regulator [Pseudoduganella buxea]|nr:helix-turn-helix transcriptional regulator [Pseudoduganella buxea]
MTKEIRMGYRNACAMEDGDLTTLLEVDGWQELTDAARRLLTRLQLDGCINRMRITDGNGRSHVHLLSTMAAEVHAAFRDTDPAEDDCISRHINRQAVPLAWAIDDACSAHSALPYRQLKSAGIQSGWSVGTRSEQFCNRIDIYSSSPQRFARNELHSELLLFSCYLNDAMRALWLRQNPQARAPLLTPREQQCLRWSASGKTSNEIGIILGISQNTVYFHLKKAASKFEVYGTRHAISRAMEMGLL